MQESAAYQATVAEGRAEEARRRRSGGCVELATPKVLKVLKMLKMPISQVREVREPRKCGAATAYFRPKGCSTDRSA